MAARVQEDLADGRAVGVDRTPTFFIDNRKFVGAIPFDQFSQILNQELVERGTPTPAPATASPGPKVQEKKSSPTGASAQRTQPSSGVLGGGGESTFSSFQAGGGCSEKESEEEQPTLISTSKARTLFEDQQALFVDVRSSKAFAAAHIRGAINLPSDEIAERAKTLPEDHTIVFYEGGKSGGQSGDVCAASRSAGRYLLMHGYSAGHVLVYQDGLEVWERARLPVQHGQTPSP